MPVLSPITGRRCPIITHTPARRSPTGRRYANISKKWPGCGLMRRGRDFNVDSRICIIVGASVPENGGANDSVYAHSGNDKDLRRPGAEDHLLEVAERASALAKAACPADEVLAATAYVAGLLHDLGKYQEEWQQYLKDSVAGRRSVRPTCHWKEPWHAAMTLGIQALCLAVLGHHAGLADFSKAQNDLEVRHPDFAQLVEKLLSAAKGECLGIPDTVADHPLDAEDGCSRHC